MPVVKVIEVIASSEKSFDDAVQNAVKEISKTIKNIDSVYVKDFKCHVQDNKIISYGVICKVSFRVDSSYNVNIQKAREQIPSCFLRFSE